MEARTDIVDDVEVGTDARWPEPDIDFASLLRAWRQRRGLTQLDLALAAELSAKHLSFLETGRALPSRDMLLRLCRVLDLPLRERNVLLTAAGFAPSYRRTPLADPTMSQVRQALALLLERHEPYPAVAVDPGWTVLMANDAYVRTLQWLGGRDLRGGQGIAVHGEPPVAGSNALLPLFDPEGVRRNVANFEVVAPAMLMRVHREAVRHPRARDLLRKLLALPGCPSPWTGPVDDAQVLVPLVLAHGGIHVSTFLTITTLGTAQDITAQEVHIETFFPADEGSERFFRTRSVMPPLPRE